MSAPPKHTVLYFPHFVDHGKKMHYIDHNYEHGYRAWFKLLEELGKADYHVLIIDDKMSLAYLSSICKMSLKTFKLFLTDMVETVEAFDKELFDHGIIWDQEFVNSIEHIYKKRTLNCPTRQEVVDNFIIPVTESAVSTSENPEIVTDNRQSKVEYTTVKETKVTSKRFAPPELYEVSDYFKEKGLTDGKASQEAEKFINHYTSNGWKVGKAKMVSWKAAAGGWMSRMSDFKNSKAVDQDGIPSEPNIKWLNDYNRTPQEFMNALRKWKEAGFEPVRKGVNNKVVDFKPIQKTDG